MRAFAVVALLRVTADGGVSPEIRREIILAMAACLDSDGGLPPVRVGGCTITCVGDWGEARQVDGGACYPPLQPVPVQGGDFWAPGEKPHERLRPR